MIGLSANDDQELGGERQFLVEIESYLVPDDGCIPNNGKLPLLIYREAIAPRSLGEQPARTLEALFKGNGWGAAWVDGIYDVTTTTQRPMRCRVLPAAGRKFNSATRKASSPN